MYREETAVNQHDKVTNEHDKSYKMFLSHKQTFLELIRDFVKEDWVNEVAEESLSLMDKSFILADYQGKEADLVYKARIGDNDVIFYILMELQSTVDYKMTYRLLIYMTELWKRIFADEDENIRTKKDYRLPAIIPMVLYNGKRGWTSPVSFAKYQKGYEYFGKHILDFEYIMFNVNSYDEDELKEIGSLMATIFALDNQFDRSEFIRRFKKFVECIKRFTPEQWMRFKRWLEYIITPKLQEEGQKEIKGIIESTDITEVESMIMNLEVSANNWFDQARQAGIKEGEHLGLLKVARVLIEKGKTIEEVSELLELPSDVIEKLEKEIDG